MSVAVTKMTAEVREYQGVVERARAALTCRYDVGVLAGVWDVAVAGVDVVVEHHVVRVQTGASVPYLLVALRADFDERRLASALVGSAGLGPCPFVDLLSESVTYDDYKGPLVAIVAEPGFCWLKWLPVAYWKVALDCVGYFPGFGPLREYVDSCWLKRRFVGFSAAGTALHLDVCDVGLAFRSSLVVGPSRGPVLARCVGAATDVPKELCLVCNCYVNPNGHAGRCRVPGPQLDTGAAWLGDAKHGYAVRLAVLESGCPVKSRTIVAQDYTSAAGQTRYVVRTGRASGTGKAFETQASTMFEIDYHNSPEFAAEYDRWMVADVRGRFGLATGPSDPGASVVWAARDFLSVGWGRLVAACDRLELTRLIVALVILKLAMLWV